MRPPSLRALGAFAGLGACAAAFVWANGGASALGKSWMAEPKPDLATAQFETGALSPLDEPTLLPGAVSPKAEGVDPAAARRLNAEIPLSRAPIEPARPFLLTGAGADRARALECLTMAIYYEAGFEPQEGQRAVAQVVLNRLRHPAFPKTVCGVVFEGARLPGCQFSFTCDGSLGRRPEPAAWRRSRTVAAEALAGRVEPLVGGATHYHADYVLPYWGRSLHKVRQIGAHIFYRWPGAWGARVAFVGRYAGAEPAPALLAKMPASAPSAEPPTEPRADDDVGGRVVTGLGWIPSVPVIAAAESAYARAVAAHESAPSGAVAAEQSGADASARQGADLS